MSNHHRINLSGSVNRIQPANSKELRRLMDRSNLMTSNKDLSDEHIPAIFTAMRSGIITIEEKNKLIIGIILNQLKSGTRYLSGISHRGWENNCRHCGGKGFRVIMETKMEVKPCIGVPGKSLSCNGTGIKTTTCNRCYGLTLENIMAIRERIMIDESSEAEVASYGHFSKIKIANIPNSFLKNNAKKTFRVVKADEDCNGSGVYYYIPKSPCLTCKGTGEFVHDRKGIKCPTCGGLRHDITTPATICDTCGGKGRIDGNPIKCPGCGGKTYVSKRLISTGNIKMVIKCNSCNGLGTFPNNPLVDIKKLSPEIVDALKLFSSK